MHAYLITGKTTNDRTLKAEKFINGVHAIEVHRLVPINRSHTINSIREINQTLSLKSPGTRVVLLEEADKLTQEAANAFLKTLEEPPQNTIIILTAPTKDSVMDTITSRCEVAYLGLLELELSEEEKSEALKIFDELSKAGMGERFKFVEGMGDREEAIKFVVGQIYAARKWMLKDVKGKNNSAIYPQILERLIQTQKDLGVNVNIKLTLTELMLNYTK
ncbi:MAG: hypothetical protein HY376_02490 [Candidatus Blackburnbacteria bacterium]|nr:hypothetical protein [Candidatus Blackburnbacteria bacterium]